MNTQEMASRLGIEPRRLRQFLRSSGSTYMAVGSAGRYDFKETDVETISRRFQVWSAPKAKGSAPAKVTTPAPAKVSADRGGVRVRRGVSRTERDAAVWAEDGTLGVEIHIPNINDPRVRREVRARAAEEAAKLQTLLMARSMHVAQGTRRAS